MTEGETGQASDQSSRPCKTRNLRPCDKDRSLTAGETCECSTNHADSHPLLSGLVVCMVEASPY